MRYSFGDYLFDAASGNIKECLEDISEEKVKDSCDYKIFLRGKEYYEEGRVEYLHHNESNNTLMITVTGSDEYQIEFYIEERDILSSCDCPYHGVCKHTVAALLYMVYEGIENVSSANFGSSSTTVESLNFLKEHLESLSKSDLVQLVMRLAPDNFIREIHNKRLPEVDAKSIFNDVESKIHSFFEDYDLLYDPQRMEEAIMSHLNMLNGLEASLRTETGELILFLIRSIEQAFEDGYLYDDLHYKEVYFESKEFCEYVIAYVKEIAFEEKTVYLQKLDEILNETSYDTFSYIEASYQRFFSETEKGELKTSIMKKGSLPLSFLSKLYRTLESELNAVEKEKILRVISKEEEDHFLSLCKLWEDQHRYQEIIDAVNEGPEERNILRNPDIATIYLDAGQKRALNMNKISAEVLERCPETINLKKIRELAGEVDPKCIEIVKERNPEELLMFLEEENRLKEALALVHEPGLCYDWVLFSFYKRHCKAFPEETEAYLKSRIDEDLELTGMRYYERIAESLDLMKRFNPIRSRRIADEIRKNFKRRTSLVRIIRDF